MKPGSVYDTLKHDDYSSSVFYHFERFGRSTSRELM